MIQSCNVIKKIKRVTKVLKSVIIFKTYIDILLVVGVIKWGNGCKGGGDRLNSLSKMWVLCINSSHLTLSK